MERNLRDDKEHRHLVVILSNCRCFLKEGATVRQPCPIAVIWQARLSIWLHWCRSDCLAFSVQLSYSVNTVSSRTVTLDASGSALVFLLSLHALARAITESKSGDQEPYDRDKRRVGSVFLGHTAQAQLWHHGRSCFCLAPAKLPTIKLNGTAGIE